MEERLKKIIAFIKNYRKYSKGDEFIDCYQVFELNNDENRNNLLNEIKNKKLKILFHPDLYAFIPPEYQEDFLVLSNFTKDLENIFREDYLKTRYDENLKQQAAKKSKKITVSDKEILTFNSAIITNICKYGFNLTSYAIKEMITYNQFKRITRENHARENAINLGREKISYIINAFNPSKDESLSINWNIIRYYSFLLYQNDYLMNLMNIYLEACQTTIYKYGPSQLSWAINESLNDFVIGEKEKIYKGFTNVNNARANLKEFIKDPKELLFLTKIYLNINLSKEEVDKLIEKSDTEIIKKFAEVVGQEQGREHTKKGR